MRLQRELSALIEQEGFQIHSKTNHSEIFC